MVNWIKNWISNIFNCNPRIKSWKDVEYFDESWKIRIQTMSQFIDKNDSVIDLGCGKMWLKEFLHSSNSYIPVDYINRADYTIICDFNKYEFPANTADISFISGCLEYINDYTWFINKVCNHCERCIISYCIFEKYPNIKNRKKSHWVNHLLEKDIIKLFAENGFYLTHQVISPTQNYIYCFDKNS
jgi:hypothetical protein